MAIRLFSLSKQKLYTKFCHHIYTLTNPRYIYPPLLLLSINPTKTLNPSYFQKPFSTQSLNFQKNSFLPLNRDGNYNDATVDLICPGCGVPLQDTDVKKPGFFIKPVLKTLSYKSQVSRNRGFDEIEASNCFKKGAIKEVEFVNPRVLDGKTLISENNGVENEKNSFLTKTLDGKTLISENNGVDEIESFNSVESVAKNEVEIEKSSFLAKALDGKPLVSENNEIDEIEAFNSVKRVDKNEVKFEKDENIENPSLSKKPIVCARCHSLRHYGRVKDPTVENLLPDFDFDYTVGKKLNLVTGARSVVLMVVDVSDFDGSFPRKVAKLVSSTIDENSASWKEGKSGNLPRVVLVVTKIDLLPPSVSPTRLEHWVRTRAREGGANKITSLHFVSAFKNWGLKNLFDDVVGLAGKRGSVWAIGAQNAGKSTLINSIGKFVGGKVVHLTEAPVPGTTLGIVRVEGVLPGQTKLFDTPGLLHPHQISTRLNREEQKLVQISKELKPRTYRLKAGHSVHMGGLMRLDVEESSVDSIYVTVWASPYLPLHMGKTENVENMLADHFGRQLEPPIGEKRVEELGHWARKEFHVCGNTWEWSSVDIAAGGVGWFAIGLKGEASVGVWCYDGVDVVLRNSLIPHRANYFEVAGFTVSKIVSKADQASSKLRHQSGKKQQQSALKTEAIVATVQAL